MIRVRKGTRLLQQGTHMEFLLVRPMVAILQYECLLAGQLRIEQCLEGMVKYMCHLTGSRAELLQNRVVIEKGYQGSDHYHVQRDEWIEGVDVRRAQWECDFFITS
jgi:hypothetical protein